MSLYTINDVELEIDMEDYDFQKAYEDAFDQMAEEEKELQKVGKKSDITFGYCEMFYRLFDNIFGEGTGKKLFNGKHNLRLTDETYEEFINICREQALDASKRQNALANKYKPKNRSEYNFKNRAQRRARR